MAASPAQIAANRANSLKSCGPKTVEGKEAARRNALKHGLTGAGVVIPGEDEQEVGIRVAALEAQLVPEGDVLGALLVRQVAIASIRVERAFRQETADAAERMRQAAEVYDDQRLTLAQEILAEIHIDPVTIRRRLLATPEGVDALVGRLRKLRVKTDSPRQVVWDDEEGTELELCLGNKPGQTPLSRSALLTRGIAFDHWVGLDPAEFAEMDFPTRLHWAVAEVQKIIDAEISDLAAFRATMDTTRRDRGRAEAAERSLVDKGKEGTALRRYAGAAERTMLKVLHELRLARAEAEAKDLAGTATRPATTEILKAAVTERIVQEQVRGESASFGAEPRERSRPGSRGVLETLDSDSRSSFAAFAVGRGPDRPQGSVS